MTEDIELRSIGTTEATAVLISSIVDFYIQLDFKNNPFWAMVQCLLLMGTIYIIGCTVASIAYAAHRY